MPRPFPQGIGTDAPVSGPGQNPGIPGPAGPPGPGFRASLDLSGTAFEQQVVGFRSRPISLEPPTPGQTHIFDGLVWEPGNPGISVDPLSRTLFVDAGTEAGFQDGSIGRPFADVQQAAAVVNASEDGLNWHIIVGPGTYGPVTLTGKHFVVIEGSSPDTCVIDGTYFPGVLLQPPTFFDFFTCYYTLRNLRITGSTGVFVDTFNYPQPPVIVIDDCVIEGLSCQSGESLIVRGRKTNIYFANLTGPLVMDDGTVSSNFFSNANATLRGVHVDCSTFSAQFDMRNCTFGFGVNLSHPFSSGPLRLDGRSLFDLLNKGGTLASPPGVAQYNPDVPWLVGTAGTNFSSTATVPVAQLPVGSSVTLDVMVVARTVPLDDSGGYRLAATFKNVSGTVQQVGSTTRFFEAEDDPTWDCDLVTDGGDTVLAQVTGGAFGVRWVVYTKATSSPFKI